MEYVSLLIKHFFGKIEVFFFRTFAKHVFGYLTNLMLTLLEVSSSAYLYFKCDQTPVRAVMNFIDAKVVRGITINDIWQPVITTLVFKIARRCTR